jgi:tetratricopeptide (TPR) repeat protein
MAVNLRQPTETRFLARPALLIGWAIVLALVATCYVTAYRPVVAAAGWMARSAADAARGDLDRAEQDLLNAARADRASAAPWVALSDLRWRLWLQRPSPRSFQNYEQALLRAVTARPYQVSLWLRLGDAYLSGYQTLKDRNYLDTAIDSYRQAVRLYPHHAREHAKLSLALAIAGRRETAEAEAAEAVRLDQATPHADQKLRPELRAELAGAGLAGGGRSP